MMTKIEIQAMDADNRIHREMKKANELDWEQRRYELAKEIFLQRIVHYGCSSIQADVEELVAWADRLIVELQKEK